MNTYKILPVNREHLLLMQVLCWLGPGIKILITGCKALHEVQVSNPERIWWLSIIAVVVAISFSFMFNNFIKRYTERILTFRNARNRFLLFLTCMVIYSFFS